MVLQNIAVVGAFSCENSSHFRVSYRLIDLGTEWSTSWACLPTGVCSARRQCTCQTVAFQSPKSLHDGIYAPLHVISWAYLDIVSARSSGGHLLSLVRRCSTLCQMIYEIPQSA